MKIVVPGGSGQVGAWAAEFEGADAVINLAGRSVNCRYTATNRREILGAGCAGAVHAGRPRPAR